ncbi:hypothetical protein [Gallaecimonas mangrovi]|uniref:hypothetical protein n=1 Tax=Gallaecimonas mangrovi TaxID=2291597 RepID=UPI001867367B|nr:hypothetical protein [Gallaecimonas mangrovi]
MALHMKSAIDVQRWSHHEPFSLLFYAYHDRHPNYLRCAGKHHRTIKTARVAKVLQSA